MAKHFLNRKQGLIAQIEELGTVVNHPNMLEGKFDIDEQTVLDALHAAESFIIDMEDDDDPTWELKVIPELFRLPYPTCWFQCEFSKSGQRNGVLAHEAEGENGLILRTACFIEQQGYWAVVDVNDVTVEMESNGEFGFLFESSALYAYPSEMRDEFQHRTELFYQALAQWLTAINCSNIDKELVAGPKGMNRKRQAKGRFLFDSYRQVVIRVGADYKKNGANKGGTHRSPRLHLRRGHIRRLQDGRHVWVNSSVVGTGNTVEKQYLVEKAK